VPRSGGKWGAFRPLRGGEISICPRHHRNETLLISYPTPRAVAAYSMARRCRVFRHVCASVLLISHRGCDTGTDIANKTRNRFPPSRETETKFRVRALNAPVKNCPGQSGGGMLAVEFDSLDSGSSDRHWKMSVKYLTVSASRR